MLTGDGRKGGKEGGREVREDMSNENFVYVMLKVIGEFEKVMCMCVGGGGG